MAYENNRVEEIIAAVKFLSFPTYPYRFSSFVFSQVLGDTEFRNTTNSSHTHHLRHATTAMQLQRCCLLGGQMGKR